MSLLMLEAGSLGVESHFAAPAGSATVGRLGHQFPHVTFSLLGIICLYDLVKLLYYLGKYRIRVIDAHSSKAHGLALLLKLLGFKGKVVVHRRVDNSPGQGLMHRIKYKSMYVDHFVAISQAINRVLVEWGVQPERVTTVRSAVIDNGLPTLQEKQRAKEALCAELGWNREIPIIASIGYMTDQKGHDTLLKALAFLKQQGVEYQCFLAGDGPLRASLEASAHQLGLWESGRVCFLGVRDDVKALLDASDVMSMPSNNEGLGTTILDGLLAGLGVAATEIGGIPEIIQHDKTGLLSEVGDGDGHGRQLERLLTDQELCSQLARDGRSYVLEQFSLSNMVAGNVEIYKKLVRK